MIMKFLSGNKGVLFVVRFEIFKKGEKNNNNV